MTTFARASLAADLGIRFARLAKQFSQAAKRWPTMGVRLRLTRKGEPDSWRPWWSVGPQVALGKKDAGQVCFEGLSLRMQPILRKLALSEWADPCLEWLDVVFAVCRHDFDYRDMPTPVAVVWRIFGASARTCNWLLRQLEASKPRRRRAR